MLYCTVLYLSVSRFFVVVFFVFFSSVFFLFEFMFLLFLFLTMALCPLLPSCFGVSLWWCFLFFFLIFLLFLRSFFRAIKTGGHSLLDGPWNHRDDGHNHCLRCVVGRMHNHRAAGRQTALFWPAAGEWPTHDTTRRRKMMMIDDETWDFLSHKKICVTYDANLSIN